MNMAVYRLTGISLLCLLVLVTFSCSQLDTKSDQNEGILYVVVAVDTEPAAFGGEGKRLDVDFSNFAIQPDSGYVPGVMTPAWRKQHSDSWDESPRFTWFVLTSEQLCQAEVCAAVLRQLEDFADEIKRWGDEIGWHYHHTDWVPVIAGDSLRNTWNQLITFNGTAYTNGTDIQLCENCLNHLIVDAGFFPLSFRSGWCWENNDFSNWLDDVIPYDLSSIPPTKAFMVEHNYPRSGACDWSRAPLDWRPYRPDSSDYQRPGNLKRFISRAAAADLAYPHLLDLERELRAGHDQLLPIAVHSYSNLPHVCDDKLSALADFCRERDLRFKFVTATEGFRRMLGLRRPPVPSLRLVHENGSILLQAKGQLFQNRPYTVIAHSDGSLQRVKPQPDGDNRWILSPVDNDWRAAIAAMSDLWGNVVVDSVVLADSCATDNSD
jgi:hypothetical protein